MRQIKYFLFIATVFFLTACTEPLPEFEEGNVIKPGDRTQEQMNADVIAKYNNYKQKFLQKTPSGRFYYIGATGTNESKEAATISEAHGYGMIIFALSKHDNEAKNYFDGMNALRKMHPSTINSDLMSWVIFPEWIDSDVIPPEGEGNNDIIGTRGRGSSAADGDLDIAYALLLAHKRWGDAAYLNEAKTVIEAIKKSAMGKNSRRTKLGDWQSGELNTRSSDWMPGHFRAFHKATGDAFWIEAADTVYALLSQVSNKDTGLMPDFATARPLKPDPNSGGTGEPNGTYYYANACRVPWRLATDYVHNNTPEAKTQINKISSWLKKATGSDPEKITSGYQLDGAPANDWAGGMHFTAPFAAGMIADANNQAFLNKIYNFMVNRTPSGEYGAAIQLLCMMLITENWKAPN